MTRLRAHYFVPDVPDGLACALADDWADDLARFPVWAVKLACDGYRRTEAMRRPTPADIIERCHQEVGFAAEQMGEIKRALMDAETEQQEKIMASGG